MQFTNTPIAGLTILEPKIWGDDRGYFFESYNEKIFHAAGIEATFVQDNQSSSGYGVLRGLHYQTGAFAQAKLVRVLSGKVLDVVIDIREGSPTYGASFSIELSEANKKQLFIPRGFAHGFIVLSEQAVFYYKCDNFYSKEHEGGIMYNDPKLNIDWQVSPDKLILSDKDKVHPNFGEHLKFHPTTV